jgi:hypothetical protein
MQRNDRVFMTTARGLGLALAGLMLMAHAALGQGVTRSAMSGVITDTSGQPLEGASIVALHTPSGMQFGSLSRASGAFNIPNMRVGGPYTVTVTMIGFRSASQENVTLRLGQTFRLDFTLEAQAVELQGVEVVMTRDEIFNADRTGAATFIDDDMVLQMPSVKRSQRDLIRLDPRNDGNYAFAGRNWLYNNITLDGSYFNNSFGLDDPAPGGQTNAEPVPFDAIAEVQVSIAPFDVRESGFTGANVNTVTKSGTNSFEASAYTYWRNESLLGNKVSGNQVVADPNLSFNQSGFTLGGPIKRDKIFFFINGEIERRDDPGSNFVASTGGASGLGLSRVDATTMDAISQRLQSAYGYDTGPYQGYVHETNNNKILAKLDFNLSENDDLSFRYNFLDAERDLPPHPFVLSFNNAGRGPNSTSLPFQNAGYQINNEIHSLAAELNSRGDTWANRLFASYNRFRDFRSPFSEDFPTVEIGEAGVGYTTLGSEPFSVHNILDTDILQITNNLTFFRGDHSITVGANFESFSFFNSFNIFRHGVFFLPYQTGIGSTFASLDEFFEATDPTNPDQVNLRGLVTPPGAPFKGEKIHMGTASAYIQDELLVNRDFTLSFGLRIDLPMYFTDPVDNPFSRGLSLLDGDRQPETVDQSKLPGTTPHFSPRVGFNWDVNGDQTMQLRGGSGIFTGRVPYVWLGNVISNPGANPDVWGPFNTSPAQVSTSDDSILQQSFDLNAVVDDFKFPQVWVTDVAVDRRFGGGWEGTLELLYGKDINAIYMRNANLVAPVRTLRDGRPYYGGFGANELNTFNGGGAGVYVLDNTSDGWNFNVTAQIRKQFENGLNTSLSYSFTEARNRLKSTEIASVLWQNQPVQGDPNNPQLSFSEFNQRHRIVGSAFWGKEWSDRTSTSFGVFLEVAEGNRFLASGGNRYSFIYAGDVNGDGQGGNDLIFIPESQSDINLADPSDWTRLDAFIEQDAYLSSHRGEIAERFGAVNPWYSNIDLRILQDIRFDAGDRAQTVQLSLDVLNVANLVNSNWGVRKFANPAATSPLTLVEFDQSGEPVFDFTGPDETYLDDPSVTSRWRVQLGAKVMIR